MQPFRTLNRALARLLSVRLCNVPHAYSVRLRAYLACSYAIFPHAYSARLRAYLVMQHPARLFRALIARLLSA